MLCLREHQVLCWRLRNKMHPLPPLSHEGLSPSFAQSAGDTAKKAATSRRKRYLSGSSAHSDFIAPSSPIYPPSRHGAASGAGAGPGSTPLGPFPAAQGEGGTPAADPPPASQEEAWSPARGAHRKDHSSSCGWSTCRASLGSSV